MFTSRAQSRFFHAAAGSKKTAKRLGISQATAKKFVADSHGQKVSKLPERVQNKAKGGSVAPRPFRW